MGALDGLRVLDLSRILAGPWASQLLADLGADVIKVENPDGGDDTRRWGPPWAGSNQADSSDTGSTGESAYYLCANRGKRSVTLNLKDHDDQERVRALAADSDILLENFKVGGAKKLGLDYERLAAINPRLVYCSITGFGQTGPYREQPGYDFLVQAMGGLMSITGERDGLPGGGPQKIGVALSDIMTGLYATIGILAAINERHRSGQGQYIDLALLDVTAASLANQAANYLIGGVVPERLGNAHPNIVPYQSFATRDGHIIVAVGNDSQFARFATLIGQPALASDPRFATNPARVAHREELLALLENTLRNRDSADWLAALNEAGVPGGPINRIDEVFADPQLRARDMVISLEHPQAGHVDLVGNPLKFSRTPVRYERAPPRLGEHNAEVLGETSPPDDSGY